MAEKSEQMIPIAQHTFGPGAHFLIRAASIPGAVPFHSSSHEIRGIQELLTVDVAFTESVPATQDMPDFLEHVLGKHIGVRTASAVLEPFELANHMSPAQLSKSIFVVAAVSGMVIRGDHPFESATQNGSKDFSSPACSEGKIDHQRRNENPKIASIPFALPSGLIDIEVTGLAKSLPYFLR